MMPSANQSCHRDFFLLLPSDWLISEPHTTLTMSTTIYFWYRTKK